MSRRRYRVVIHFCLHQYTSLTKLSFFLVVILSLIVTFTVEPTFPLSSIISNALMISEADLRREGVPTPLLGCGY